MKRLLLLLLAVAGCARPDEQYTNYVTDYAGNPLSGKKVEVRDCTGQHVIPIFADDRLIIPMVNPFVTDPHGGYTFWARDCAQVLVEGISY